MSLLSISKSADLGLRRDLLTLFATQFNLRLREGLRGASVRDRPTVDQAVSALSEWPRESPEMPLLMESWKASSFFGREPGQGWMQAQIQGGFFIQENRQSWRKMDAVFRKISDPNLRRDMKYSFFMHLLYSVWDDSWRTNESMRRLWMRGLSERYDRNLKVALDDFNLSVRGFLRHCTPAVAEEKSSSCFPTFQFRNACDDFVAIAEVKHGEEYLHSLRNFFDEQEPGFLWTDRDYRGLCVDLTSRMVSQFERRNKAVFLEFLGRSRRRLGPFLRAEFKALEELDGQGVSLLRWLNEGVKRAMHSGNAEYKVRIRYLLKRTLERLKLNEAFTKFHMGSYCHSAVSDLAAGHRLMLIRFASRSLDIMEQYYAAPRRSGALKRREERFQKQLGQLSTNHRQRLISQMRQVFRLGAVAMDDQSSVMMVSSLFRVRSAARRLLHAATCDTGVELYYVMKRLYVEFQSGLLRSVCQSGKSMQIFSGGTTAES